MIVEPVDLSADDVLAAVRDCWDPDVVTSQYVQVGAGAHHWVIHGTAGPRWFATADRVFSGRERRSRTSAYATAAALAAELDFVLAPSPTRARKIAVLLEDRYLVSVAPWVRGVSGYGPFTGEPERAEAAALLGRLHSTAPPPGTPTWRPNAGRHESAQRPQLERLLRLHEWNGGPYADVAGRLLAGFRAKITGALKCFDELAEAVTSTTEGWVITHGEPHTANLLGTAEGLRLVDWDTVAVAPRERDLRDVIAAAHGPEPWRAYVAAGGTDTPLARDSLKLFALEWHLSEVAEYAVRFSQPHSGSEDDRRCLADLEEELAALSADRA